MPKVFGPSEGLVLPEVPISVAADTTTQAKDDMLLNAENSTSVLRLADRFSRSWWFLTPRS